MTMTQSEINGKLTMAQLFTAVWFGNWEDYEAMIGKLPEEMLEHLPFQQYYDRRTVKLAYENYFVIPGDYFIPPYVSSYYGKYEEEQQKARHDLLCLVGAYEKVGYYYPIEKDELPDHIGSITGFMAALIQEEAKAYQAGDEDLMNQVQQLQREVYDDYLKGMLVNIKTAGMEKIDDPFFQEFFPFYMETLDMMVHTS